MTRPKLRHWVFPISTALLLTGLFAAAGIWQTHRAEYKDALRQRAEAAEAGPTIAVPSVSGDVAQLDFRRLEASGRWLADKTILLDNKLRDGVVGYEVVTPLKPDQGEACILVNRGWVSAPPRRDTLPAITTPEGRVQVQGIARVPSNRFLELSEKGIVGQVWENLTIERYARWSGLPLQPVMIYQEGGLEDGLVRVAVAPEVSGLGADRHRGYAFMWFSLAALTVLIAGILLYTKVIRHDPD